MHDFSYSLTCKVEANSLEEAIKKSKEMEWKKDFGGDCPQGTFYRTSEKQDELSKTEFNEYEIKTQR